MKKIPVPDSFNYCDPADWQSQKYTLVTVSDIHTQIALTTDVKGYTVGLLEVFLPDDEELRKMTDEETDQWIAENNERMEAICKFLNER